jgi:hypothetical protein
MAASQVGEVMAVPIKPKEDKTTLKEFNEKKKLIEEGKTTVGFHNGDKHYIENYYKVFGELPKGMSERATVNEGDYEWRNRSKAIVEGFRKVLEETFNGVVSRSYIMQEVDILMKEYALKKARSIAMAGRFLRMNRTTFIESLKAQGIWDARNGIIGSHHIDALESPAAFELTKSEIRRSREEMLRYVASVARKDRQLSVEALRILEAVENLKKVEKQLAHSGQSYEQLDIERDAAVLAILRDIALKKPLEKVSSSESVYTERQTAKLSEYQRYLQSIRDSDGTEGQTP